LRRYLTLLALLILALLLACTLPAPRLAEIRRGIQRTLAEAGLDTDDIDVVLRTGGSSWSADWRPRRA
jgi:hypothetical protein